MTIEEAIIELSIQRDDKRVCSEIYEAKALALGIEALKRVQNQNKHRSVSQRWLLPGETKECYEVREMTINKNYPLASEHDPDFDKPHQYTKSWGDGSIRNYCRCGREKGNPLHIEEEATSPGETRE